MAYSLDYRKRVMEIKAREDLTFESTSKRFGVGIATLFRWKNRLEPCETRNKPATKINMQKLAQDVEDHPDSYYYERDKRFEVCQSAIGYALRRLGVSCKKNHKSPQSR